MSSRQCLLKYGEKALEYYRKSLQKSMSPTHSEGMSEVQSHQNQIEQHSHLKPVQRICRPEVYKKLTLDAKNRPKIKEGAERKKPLSRSKSKTQLADIEPTQAAIPTLRKASKETDQRLRKSNSQLNVRQSQTLHIKRPSKVPGKISLNQDPEARIKASLEIRDMDTFVKDVLNNISSLIASEATISRWLGYFKQCFERLYAVSEEYIRRYALAAEEVSKLNQQLEELKEKNRRASQSRVKENSPNQGEDMITGLARKLERYEQREKILMSTLQFLKCEGDLKNVSLLQSFKADQERPPDRIEREKSSPLGKRHRQSKKVYDSVCD